MYLPVSKYWRIKEFSICKKKKKEKCLESSLACSEYWENVNSGYYYDGAEDTEVNRLKSCGLMESFIL